ncbi:MAG TPA: DMT family transporter, partial [Beutenbergiaceae bacterium]|nr:DMT family transporter [Beutenbergiaceae bacterium]
MPHSSASLVRTVTSRGKAPPTRAALPAVAVVVTALMWASSFVIVRWAAPVFAPQSLALLRLVAGTVALTVLVMWLRRGRLRRPGLPGVLLAGAYGVLWFALYTVALNGAGHWLDAGTISLVINLAPLMIAVGAGIFFGEGFPRRLFIGMAVSLVGVAIIATAGGTGQLAVLGLLIAFGAAVLYAAGMLLQKVTLRHTDPLTATWLACAAGMLSLLPFAGQTITELQQAPSGAIIGAVYMGIGPTALGFWFWGYAMNHFPTGRVASASLAIPAVVVAMSAITLREIPPPLGIAGGALCLAGVAVSQWRK